MGACGEIRVKRDDDSRGRVRVGIADQQRGQTAVTVIDDPVFAVDGSARECRRKRADRAGVPERLRRLSNENGAWIKVREPDYWSVIRPKIRIDREIVTPIAPSATPTTQPDRRSHRRPSDNRADTRDCAAGTPTQVLPA